MNLLELLKKYKIEIPMLQRDYAQGRISQKELANKFLQAIFNALNNNKNLHIDFIYGTQKDEKFILIDGQQRITTLWLIHFLIFARANRLDEIKDLLANFSYNTRESSKRFCKNLLFKHNYLEHEQSPSIEIKNKGGEFGQQEDLNNDPTIKAMLNMLDWISQRLEYKNDLNKLIKNLNNISFDLFDMGKFDLDEDLYIKMNARGKMLSKFENLKAYLEQDSNIAKDSAILANIDNIWSDYFFNAKDIDSFDTRGLHFLHYAALFFNLKESSTIDIKYRIENPTNTPIDEFYLPLKNIDNIKLLDSFIEFVKISDFPAHFPRLDSAAFFDKLGYKEICYFFATLAFLQQSKSKSAFYNYARVCSHFIENHRLDKPNEHIKPFLALFLHLANGANDIYDFLAKNPNYSFSENIYKLEARKATLILQNRKDKKQAWENILNKTSDDKFLKGWVDFLLDFSDKHWKDEIDNNKKLNAPQLDKFIKYANITMQIFNNKFLEENLGIFQRAFLCMGDFGIKKTNYFYGNVPFDIFRDRESWHMILIGENDYGEQYFKPLLDEILESKNDLKTALQDIINNANLENYPWYMQLLIAQKEHFDFINEDKKPFQHYRRIRFFCDNDGGVIAAQLLKGVQSKKGIKNLLSYAFYLYCKECGLKPDEYNDEIYENGETENAYFYLNNKKIQSDDLSIKIATKSYRIKQDCNIFNEFKRILKEAFCGKLKY